MISQAINQPWMWCVLLIRIVFPDGDCKLRKRTTLPYETLNSLKNRITYPMSCRCINRGVLWRPNWLICPHTNLTVTTTISKGDVIGAGSFDWSTTYCHGAFCFTTAVFTSPVAILWVTSKMFLSSSYFWRYIPTGRVYSKLGSILMSVSKLKSLLALCGTA